MGILSSFLISDADPKHKSDNGHDSVVDFDREKLDGSFVSVLQLQMVFMCMGVDTKSQYLSAVDKEAQAAAALKDEDMLAEIGSLPEITKSVRNLFESGKIAEHSAESQKVRIYESLPEWGVYESKPTQLEGVVRATDRPTEGDEIQRGMTSSLLSQWTRIGMDDNTQIDKPAFRLAYDAAPGSGIFESQPTLLDGVIRAVDNLHEERIQRGLTKSLLGQWSNISKDELQRPVNGPMKKPTYEVTPGSGVFENEPTKIEGVVRESDVADETEQIRRGMTKSLLSQWQNQGSAQPRTSVRRVISVADDEGSVSENAPVRRSDVVHADDVVDESEQIIQGIARALLSEWKTKGSEGFQITRQAINVAEAEGSVSENEPVRRSDVVHADDTLEGEVIQTGTTKMLLGQWKTMGSSGQTAKEKAPIVVAEGEGRVAENEPVRRSDVMRENDAEGEQIQQGITRSLLNQWKSMGSSSDDSWKSRTPIVLDEAEGKVLESEPVRRTDVVHSDDFVEDRVEVQSGITKSLLSQWKSKGSEEFRMDRKSIVLNEDEGAVAESEPAQRRDDVVREDIGSMDTEQILRDTTKNLRAQWQNKAFEEFKANKKPIILAEAEGSVSENEPLPRLNVTREADGEPDEAQVQSGTTKSLLAQWKVKGTEEFKAEKRPIVLAEAEDCVAENEPVKRTDVVHADDLSDIAVERGTTKSLLSQWKNKTSEEFKAERKPIVLAEDEGRVSESDPVKREGVVRAEDLASEGEVVLKGYTKSLLTQWKNKPNEEVKIEKKRIIIQEDEGTIAESTPAVREDVVRCDEIELADEKVQRGFTKNLRQQWMTKGSEKFQKEKQPIIVAEGEGTVSENEPVRRSDVVHYGDPESAEEIQSGITKNLRAQWLTKGSEKFHIEKKSIVIAEDEGTVAENEPVRRSDIVHSDDLVNSDQVQRGITKNLRTQWMNKGSEEIRTERPPIVVAEGEGTVSENEPVRRSDVVRCDDAEVSEQVLKGITKNLRAQWMTKGSEEFQAKRAPIVVAEDKGSVAENEPVRRSDVVHYDDAEVDEQALKGITKNLRAQWMTKGSEEFHVKRAPIVIAEDKGSVAENEPVRRSDVVHSDDAEVNEQALKGITKNLRAQWMTKGSEEFQVKRTPIVIAEDKGSVAENEPVRRSDVIHYSDDAEVNEAALKGITKNLRAQWMTKGTEEFQVKRAPIVIAEDKGSVAENEPVRRSDVVHSDEAEVNEQALQGITKNLRAQWMTKGTEEFQVKREPIVIAEDQGSVAENEPVRRSDVVHSDDAEVNEQALKGITKNLRDHWMTKGTEEFQVRRAPIVLAEDKGSVAENDPVIRSDVVHCDDAEVNEQALKGITKNLRAQWMTKGTEKYQVKRAPIVIAEDKGSVAENEPVRRSDVVHSDDAEVNEQALQGMTKKTREQWMTKGSKEFQVKRTPIVIAEDKGSVAENEPVRRSDVVHCDEAEVNEQALKGITKNLRAQWMTKGTEEFQVKRAPIVIAEDKGSVAENEPVRRSDVVHCDEAEVNEQALKGITKNLTAQWMTKGTEEFQVKRAPIVIAEDKGSVAENDPVRRSDVVHCDEAEVSEQALKGIAKNLRAQWMTKGSEEFQVKRAPIVIAEDKGSVAENEPVRRSDVVHYDDTETTEQVQKGLAKNLKEQWITKGSEQYQKEKKPIVIAEGEGTVAENQPVTRSDVVHSDYVDDKDQVQRGITKNLREQWLTKGSEEFRIDKAPIVLAEGEGTVAENEPVRRSDVVHYDDLEAVEQVQLGITKNLRAQWMTKGSEEYYKEKAPIVVAEDEGKVAENEPIRRSGVVHSDDICEEGEFVQRGTAKSLLDRWSNSATDEPVIERRPIVIAEDEGRVLESEPTRRTDVVHADDVEAEMDVVQKGTTKSLLSQWKCKGTEEFKTERKVINVAEAEGKVAENEPLRRSDVVHADDVFPEQDHVQRGMAKSLTTQWSKKGTEEFKVERKPIILAEAEGKIAESEPIRRDDVIHYDDLDTSGESVSKGLTKNLLSQWAVKGSEEFVVERKRIVVADGEGKISENEPITRTDVVRADDCLADGEEVQKGMAKSLVSQWKHKGEEEFQAERKPIVLAEVEGQVVENEPTVRTDVVRSDEISTEGETIKRGTTKTLLTQWKTKGTEEYKPQRKTIIIEDKLPTS